jgi:hypothetical protein
MRDRGKPWGCIVLFVLSSCGSTSPYEPTTPAFVTEKFGTWQYDTSLRLAFQESPADTLDCVMANAVLTISGPVDVGRAGTFDPPYGVHGSLAGGSLECQGKASLAFTQQVPSVVVNVGLAIVTATIDFKIATPHGEVRVHNFSDYSTSSSNIQGLVEALTDPRYLDSGPPWSRGLGSPGTFSARRP